MGLRQRPRSGPGFGLPHPPAQWVRLHRRQEWGGLRPSPVEPRWRWWPGVQWEHLPRSDGVRGDSRRPGCRLPTLCQWRSSSRGDGRREILGPLVHRQWGQRATGTRGRSGGQPEHQHRGPLRPLTELGPAVGPDPDRRGAALPQPNPGWCRCLHRHQLRCCDGPARLRVQAPAAASRARIRW